MLVKSKLVTSYYLVVIAFLAFQAISTVYQGSQIVSHGKTLAQLEKEKMAMMAQSASLKQTLAASSSLLHITNSPVYNQFQPISQVIKIDQQLTVASR